MRNHRLCSGLLAAALIPGAVAQELEELLVTAQYDARVVDVTESLSVAADPGNLLHNAPGANLASNGPLTGIPQYRGLFGPRIAVSMDGTLLAPAGPNWMDPPISYAVTAQLEALEVYRGIAPVRVAQESLGGAIDARTRRADFGDSANYNFEGRVVAIGQSVNAGSQLDTDLQLSNERHRFKVAAMLQQGEDADFPGGTLLPTEYERERYDLGYGFRFGDHSLQLDYGRNETGDAGTPALPMDIRYIDGDLYKATYRYQPAGKLSLLASIYASDLDHGMTNYHLRPAPVAPGMFRQNIADTNNAGFRLQAELTDDTGVWRAGLDGFEESHNSNIDNPNNPMFFVVNFNDAERSVFGAYAERDQFFGERLLGEFGIRVNRVRSDAGAVNGTPAMMMPPAQALRDAFNEADRDRAETNVDLVAKLNYQLNTNTSLFLGTAQKQRGPSYQERYLWLPLEATGGLADGQVYIGDPELDSEKAYNLEIGFDFTGERLRIHPRAFYTRIDDYIQGTPLSEDNPATRMVRMMNAMNGTNRRDPLRFSNVEAELYGLDMDWSLRVSPTLELSGLVNYVRGERRDVSDDLYRIAPLNATLRLAYGAGPWRATVETIAYAGQDAVSETNRELTSAGYGFVNLRGTWQATPSLQIAVGVENLFDREFAPHLGGYNRVRNENIAVGQRLPAQGLNAFGRLMYTF